MEYMSIEINRIYPTCSCVTCVVFKIFFTLSKNIGNGFVLLKTAPGCFSCLISLSVMKKYHCRDICLTCSIIICVYQFSLSGLIT